MDENHIKSSLTITDTPELHDRLISGVALNLDVPIITNDPDIRASKHLKSIW